MVACGGMDVWMRAWWLVVAWSLAPVVLRIGGFVMCRCWFRACCRRLTAGR